jgi:GAF domain-containing protein/nitrogen-specific signal transduction histidine kinase
MATTQDEMIAELQRASTELRRERDTARAERDAALAQRDSDYGERIEYQAATIDVLKVMSASPGDPQPVFELIAHRARDLCDAYGVTVYEFDGTLLHWRAATGVSDDPSVRQAYEAMYPMAPSREWPVGRAIMDRQIIQISDVGAEPGLSPVMRGITAKSSLVVPLMRGDVVIGGLALGRRERGRCSDSQIELLKTFAEQAVIAISSAETYRALQTRTADLQESLEYQTATSDVLKVISRSTFDLQPVLDTLVETATRLCEAETGVITSREADGYRVTATFSMNPEFGSFLYGRLLPVIRGNITGRTALEGRIVHIEDIEADSEWTLHEATTLEKARTMLGVPLLREGAVTGTINLARRAVRPFTDKQIELVGTFADQAVIAIENTRLLTAQQESLEQQTATAEVLQVINASPGDLTPVFEAMLERAMRLCGGTIGGIFTFDGGHSVTSAMRGVTAAFAQYNDKYPMDEIRPGTVPARIIETRGPVQYADMTAGEPYRAGHPYARALVELGGIRAVLAVPLLKDGVAVGFVSIYRQEVGAFSDRQIVLLQNFAAQAVIAMENARLLTEQQEALEQQTATAEILQVINASPGNLPPVFDALLEKALRLCGASFGTLATYDGERIERVAFLGVPAAFIEYNQRNPLSKNAGLIAQGIATGKPVQATDIMTDERLGSSPSVRDALVELGGVRALLQVPLLKDGAVVGFIGVWRREPGVFPEKQIALLEGFAAQAVIAMENARLLTEQREALEQQTATAEVLQVINASSGDLTPVFDTMLENALRLCGAAFGTLYTYDGERFQPVAFRNVAPGFAELMIKYPPTDRAGSPAARVLETKRPVDIPDVMELENYRSGIGAARGLVEVGGVRAFINIPLVKDGKVLGLFTIYRRVVGKISDKQIALLENFATQVVIAMESARLLHELRARTDELAQRQAELRVTFENMGDGVAMFDEAAHLVASNRKFQDILDLPDGALAERLSFADYIHYLTERGEFGAKADPEEQVRQLTDRAGKYYVVERTRPDGRIIEVRHNPVPGGGFVLIYADITERKRNEAEIRAARDAAEAASRTIEAAFRDLKAAQANLIQAEKMASLGQLTAGIAHEIKNPLNFVNNFSALSAELIDELREVLIPQPLGDTVRREVDDLTALLKGNLEKVVQHGQRADGIVKAMLEHSRGSSAERRMVDLNAVIDEALNLAYHGARAQDQSFNITLERDLGEGIAPIEVNPQDMTRVFLNIFSNGFYAATRRARNCADAGFVPTLKVITRDDGDLVEIRVRDNGTGIPWDIRDKLFQPFFTTKPTGEGTGLGLSITYDIVTKQHGGTITVDSEVDAFTEFVITLPRQMFGHGGDRA